MQKIKLSQAITEYLRLRERQGVKPNTLRAYRSTLEPFMRSAGDIYVCNVTVNHVEHFMANTEWGASTRNSRSSNLSVFFKWAQARGYKDHIDLMAGWMNAKVPAVDHTRVPVDQWYRLFDACEHPTDTATIAVGLYLFLRVSEARMLKVGDLNLDTGLIQVYRSKTEDRDEMQMSNELVVILREYLRWYTQHMADRGLPLKDDMILLPPRDTQSQSWLREEDQDPPLRQYTMHSALGLRIRKVIERAGYKMTESEKAGGWGGHVLRRSGARGMYDELLTQGYDGALKTVQSMLGHANSVMTERYLGLSIDKKRRNELLAGKFMFPSMQGRQSQNVIAISRKVGEA